MKSKKLQKMKTIGLLGGMSWESSIEYYRIINQAVQQRLGGVHSAQTLMFSFDFAEIETMQCTGDWEGLTAVMIKAAQTLEKGGADLLVICTNTMHRMAKEVQDALSIPLLHIADATAEAIKNAGLSSVGLLGTRFTMKADFYRGKLEKDYGLKVLIPKAASREIVHQIIYEELVRGIILEKSRREYQNVISDLAAQGAEGIILGCTEISLLIKQDDVPVPVFDTTSIHALAAVEWALRE